MLTVHTEAAPACGACRSGLDFGFALTMAFQPIVDTSTQTVWAYEALVRGEGGRSAADVLKLVNDGNRYSFDQTCRVKAIELGARLGIAARGARLSVNFLPGAVYSPAACIRRTLEAAEQHDFPLDAIIFEITEGERMLSMPHMRQIAAEYSRHHFTLALDDFGAGFSGLNMLAELDGLSLIKLDGALIHGIETNRRAQQIVASVVDLCRTLDVTLLAECVETVQEYTSLRQIGIDLMQGYLFARPEVEQLPEVTWPA